MGNSACEQLIADSFCRSLSRFVVIKAQIHAPDIRIILYYLPQYLVGHAAGGGIAVLLPTAFIHADKAQHINGRFK